MNRLIKWIIGLLVVGVGGYLILVSLTGSKVREITEEQLQSYAVQNENLTIDVVWHETGFWRSEGEVRASLVFEPGVSAEIQHTLTLRHGALSARLSGEFSAQFDDLDLADYLFDGERVMLDGRVGLGGLRATYHIPPLELTDDESDLVFLSSPFDIDLALTDREQHAHIEVDWLRLLPKEQSRSTDGVYIETIEITSQMRLDPQDGYGNLGASTTTLERITVGMDYGDPLVAEDYRMDISFEREDNDLDLKIELSLDKVSAQGVDGDGKIVIRLTDLPFAAWREFEAQASQPDYDDESLLPLLVATRDNGARLHVDSIDVGATGLGRLVANGEFRLRDDLPASTEELERTAADLFNGYLMVEDLPLPLMMTLTGFINEELPWRLEVEGETLLVNGKSLDALFSN